MTIARPNPKSRFPRALTPLLADQRAQYVLMDIGARGGDLHYWRPLLPLADVIGFEPEEEECARLNAELQSAGRTRTRMHPTALAGRAGKHPFYVTRYPFSSGLHRGNEAWLRRFPMTTLDVLREIEVEATTLDAFSAQEKLDHLDFIKVDVEGAEYDILDGARKTMADQGVLGVLTEIWWDPVIKGQHAFADIDTLMRESGFRFFDLELHRYTRSTLPAGRLSVKGVLKARPKIDPGYGQAWTGDALYFRDPVGELNAGKLDPMWTRERLLRLCGLLDIFDYGDCAIEVLEAFRETAFAGLDVDALIATLIPSLGGFAPARDAYQKLSVWVRRAVNRRRFGLDDWRPSPNAYRAKREV